MREAGGADPLVDIDDQVVLAAQVVDQRGVDGDLVRQADLEVLDAGAARDQLDVTEDDGRVEIRAPGLLRAGPRGEADGQLCGGDAPLALELVRLAADGAGAAAGLGQQVGIAQQTGEAGRPAGQQLCEARGVRAGQIDRAVTGFAEAQHGVATADPGSLRPPVDEDVVDRGGKRGIGM